MTLDPILVVDDQQAILDDFARLLSPADEPDDAALDDLASAFGASAARSRRPAYPRYQLRAARQGLDAVALFVRTPAVALARTV